MPFDSYLNIVKPKTGKSLKISIVIIGAKIPTNQEIRATLKIEIRKISFEEKKYVSSKMPKATK